MIHNISYRAFVYGTENKERVLDAIHTLFPDSEPQEDSIEGHYKNKVLVLHQKIDKKSDIKLFLHTLQKLPLSKKRLFFVDIEKKIDDRCNLFIRFDKQRAYQGGMKIVEHGDSILVKLKIAAYPAKKEVALGVVKKIFGEGDVC